MKFLLSFAGYFLGVAGGGTLALLYEKHGTAAAGTWPVLIIVAGYTVLLVGLLRKD